MNLFNTFTPENGATYSVWSSESIRPTLIFISKDSERINSQYLRLEFKRKTSTMDIITVEAVSVIGNNGKYRMISFPLPCGHELGYNPTQSAICKLYYSVTDTLEDYILFYLQYNYTAIEFIPFNFKGADNKDIVLCLEFSDIQKSGSNYTQVLDTAKKNIVSQQDYQFCVQILPTDPELPKTILNLLAEGLINGTDTNKYITYDEDENLLIYFTNPKTSTDIPSYPAEDTDTILYTAKNIPYRNQKFLCHAIGNDVYTHFIISPQNFHTFTVDKEKLSRGFLFNSIQKKAYSIFD